MKSIILFLILLLNQLSSVGQDIYLHSKEGRIIISRRPLINSCLKSLRKNRSDQTALSICECQINKLDYYFTNKQYRKNTIGGVIDITGLINADTAIRTEIEKCYTNSGQITLLQAESFENEFVSHCIRSIQNNTEKTLDTNRVKRFCNCQLELIKTKRINDLEMETLNNPNSLLSYEMIYTCGDPYSEPDQIDRNWNSNLEKDVIGPAIDTIKVLSLNGMTYIKMRVGSMSQIWLFDTGASDMLINKDMEEELKKEGIITDKNYLGNEEYEMANGMIDTCRQYRIDNLQVGQFSINNVVVAVTEKGKRIIIGRALLNKFSKWILDNKEHTLILIK